VRAREVGLWKHQRRNMLHTAYLVSAIDRRTGRVVSRGVFSEERPSLLNVNRFTTHAVLKATSRFSFSRAERVLRYEAARRKLPAPTYPGWYPPMSLWTHAHRGIKTGG